MLILRTKITFTAAICIAWYNFFLDNRVMTTTKRRISLFVFTGLCLTEKIFFVSKLNVVEGGSTYFM